MTKNKSTGSTLILFLIVIIPLILFLLLTLKNSHQGNQKLYQQTQSDALALHFSSYSTDALNAIAMYNRGIEIAAQRAYMVATALMLLRICAASTLLASPCTKYWAKLERKALPFFNKVNRLMADYANEQDRIKQWAETVPFKEMALINIKKLAQDQQVLLIPEKSSFLLPIVRDNKRNLNKRNPLYQGNDFKKCKTRIEKNLIILNSRRKKSQKKNLIHSTNYFYLNMSNGSVKKINAQVFKQGQKIPQRINSPATKSHYIFDHATIKTCQSFKKFIDRLNGKVGFRINVPAFYVLTNDYLKNGFSTDVIIKKTHANKFLTPIHQLSSDFSNKTKITSLSRACLYGDNIFKSNFKNDLCSPVPFKLEHSNAYQ